MSGTARVGELLNVLTIRVAAGLRQPVESARVAHVVAGSIRDGELNVLNFRPAVKLAGIRAALAEYLAAAMTR